MTKVLMIDDDIDYLKSLKLVLEEEGYSVIIADNGKVGVKRAFDHTPDIIILDLIMPDISGIQTCRRLRMLTKVPIIMLTASNNETSMVDGLDAGADDFLVKPCPQPILMAKIEALLRRAGTPTPVKANYADGYLDLKLGQGQVMICGQDAKLTSTEFRLLAYLFRHSDRVVPHDELINEIWGENSTTDRRSLKLYILYLRRKIEQNPDKPTYLQTAWGIGYRFHAVGSATPAD